MNRWNVLLSTIVLGAAAGHCAEGGLRVYIGTYTGGKSKGIYLCDMDTSSGRLSEPKLVAETPNPTFLALHPNSKFVYAANEIGNFEGKKTGSISAFAIDPASAQLKLLNTQPSMGPGPCHVAVAPNGKHLVAANYGGGSICAIPIKDDGSLAKPTAGIEHAGTPGPNKKRQRQPHAHSTNFDPAGRFVFAADLGLDKVLIYRLDPEKGSLTPNNPPHAVLSPGSGPRHFCFHPNGRFAYLINELLSTVTAFGYDAKKGALCEIQTIGTLPAGFDGRSTTAEVLVHPSGKFLYGSNRGHDSIAVFNIDPGSGKLTAAGHTPSGGKTPRNFNLTPDGRWLVTANQNTGDVCVYRVDEKSGQLTATEHKVSVEKPVRVLFVQ